MIFRIILVLLALCLTSCSTPGAVRLEGQNAPLAKLQQAAIKILPQGKRRVSVNGREFFSNNFVVSKGRYKKPRGNEKYRYSAHVFILGDRRPYTIEIVVNKEKRSTRGGQGYGLVRTDKGIARVLLRRMQKLLSQRREDLNIIDDFRVF